jgi:hypothetical protein
MRGSGIRNVKSANPDTNPDNVSGLELPKGEFQQSGHASGHCDRIAGSKQAF